MPARRRLAGKACTRRPQLTRIPLQHALDCRVNPPPAPFRPDTLAVQALGNAAVGQAFRPELAHTDDDLLLAGIRQEPSAATEVPAEGRVAADTLAPRPLHVHGTARPFADHGAFQLGEDAGHLRHGAPVRTAHVETLSDGYQLDAFLVEVGDDGGGIRNGAEEAIQFRHDDEDLALVGGGEQLAAGGTTREGFAPTDARVGEDFGQAESFHGAISGDALALGFESQAAVGLFFAGDADVAEGVAHGVSEFTP